MAPPPKKLTPAMRAFIAALTAVLLRDEDLWRPGRFDLPVLRRLPDGYGELGDRQSQRYEPPMPPPSQPPPGGPPSPSPSSTPGWWEVPYPGGPMVKVPGFPRPLYPPDASSQGKVPSTDGPDVIAYKRTVSRAGRWPWGTFDDSFSNGFSHGKAGGNVGDSGVAGTQRQGAIEPDSGWVGEKTFNLLRSIIIPEGLPHAGEPAMDGVAVGLIEDAWSKYHGAGELAEVEAALADYCVRSIRSAAEWHYAQVRPMNTLGRSPDDGSHDDDDCSEHATNAYYWPRTVTGVAVPDPNGNGFNGYGWTGELIQNPKVTSGAYKVGDLALYGDSPSDTEHVTTCYVAGNGSTAEWCSNGSESAPYAVELYYRTDLIYVVRPGLMP